MQTRILFGVATLAIVLAGCAGCSLNRQVPKATVLFNPATGAIEIESHKDVELKDVKVTISTNRTAVIEIGSYKAQNNIAVIEAAVKAQQQQIAGIQDGLSKILAAAAKGTP